MSDEFDLDAFVSEVTEEPFRFRFGGEQYELPARFDIRAVAALAAGRLDDALRMLLGVAQWERIQAVDAVLDERGLKALLDRYMAHSGVDLGEPLASTGS